MQLAAMILYMIGSLCFLAGTTISLAVQLSHNNPTYVRVQQPDQPVSQVGFVPPITVDSDDND